MVLRCPECNSARLVKNGVIFSGRKRKQRYTCRNCGRCTVNPKGKR